MYKRCRGAYSASEVRELVSYATSLHISVVPEIDSPGHVSAALAAYPELGDATFTVPTAFGALPKALRRSAKSLRFLREVIRDVSELVPGDYFHAAWHSDLR